MGGLGSNEERRERCLEGVVVARTGIAVFIWYLVLYGLRDWGRHLSGD